MWATLALATALNLAPAQSGTLQLKNDRATYGVLGQERKDFKLLPGDIFYVAFDIEGLKTTDEGQVHYSMLLDLLNKEGKSQFKQEPRNLDAINALGGNRVPAFAEVTIGTDTPEGEYTLKVIVKDLSTDKSETLTRKFEVLPTKFGFIRVGLCHVFPGGGAFTPAAPPIAVPGQSYLVNFAVVGFALDKDRKDQPNIDASLRILDEDGKPTLAKPFGGQATEVGPEFKKVLPMQFVMSLNRPGKFKLELKATDKITGKTAEQTLELNVVETK
jgi:hypothetical protein